MSSDSSISHPLLFFSEDYEMGSSSQMDHPECQQLIDAFRSRFGVGRGFGSPALGHRGVSDGEEGVQMNCWTEKEGPAFASVNLEGKKYNGWPIARFIEREMAGSTLMDVVDRLPPHARIEIVWMRDAWGTDGGRLSIKEQFIGGTPIPIGDLTVETWSACLAGAWACLSQDKNGRGRRRSQTVTTTTGLRSTWMFLRISSFGVG